MERTRRGLRVKNGGQYPSSNGEYQEGAKTRNRALNQDEKDLVTGARVLPHSLESEESVLGGILLDNDAMNVALERLKAEDFYRPSYQAIFAAMISLTDKREPIDVVTLSQRLKAMGLFDDSGGTEILMRLATLVPSAANVAYYARLVKENSLRRRVIREASDIINEAFSDEGELEEFLDSTEQRILGISDYRISPSFSKVGDVVQSSISIIEKLFDQKQSITGVASGFSDLDRMTAGFQPSDLIIIAARPSMGKTALALAFAANAGMEQRGGVAIFSLEMSKEQLVLRLLCSDAGVDNTKVRTGHLGENDFPKLVDSAGRIADAPIFIDDTGGLTITELRAKCRRLNKETKLSMVIVDYLQLLRSPAYSNSREQEISDISRSLKALAKELSVPVIALSQLNRSVESRPLKDKRPQMSDLRESGAIEQDADVIMAIYRDEIYNPDSEEKGIAEIIILKQRNGPVGRVKLAFSSSLTRFDSLKAVADYQDFEELPDGFQLPPELAVSNQDANSLNDDEYDDDIVF